MKRFVIWLIAPVLVAAPLSAARSDEIVKNFFGKIVGALGDQVTKEVERGFENFRNPQQENANTVGLGNLGYCQVWTGGSMVVQSQCRLDANCNASGVCEYSYIWPSGSQTSVSVRAGMPSSLNGKPTALVRVGTDACLVDTPSDIFCYTVNPQSPYAGSFVAENAPVASTAAIAPSASFETLLENYVVATENQSDPGSRSRRCEIGVTLVSEHGNLLGGELQYLIREQLKQDQCS